MILTPHVVYNKADAERMLAEESRRMDWVLGDVMKIHGPNFLDGAAGSGPVTTIIDGKTPMLEGPPPRMMPPANGPVKTIIDSKTPMLEGPPPRMMPPANGPVSPLPLPSAPLPPPSVPPASSQLPVQAPSAVSAALPFAAPERIATPPSADPSLISRVRIQNAKDLMPVLPAGPSPASSPALNNNAGSTVLPNFPTPQPVTPSLPSREVTR